MDVGEGGNLGNGGEVPNGVCKPIPPDGLFRTEIFSPTGVAVCPARNPRRCSPLCATGVALGDGFLPDLLGGRREEVNDSL